MLFGGMAVIFAAGVSFASGADFTNAILTSRPIYVPDFTHETDPMPDGVLAWSSLMQTANAAADEESVRFTFSFTNIARRMDILPVTDVTTNADGLLLTNFTTITNFTPVTVAIAGVHASCGCTQPELPPTPWIIPPGGTGVFSATVQLEGRNGTLIKNVTVATDKGSKDLWMRITILPLVIPPLSDAERVRDVEIAKTNRQAVFTGDCATCHAKAITGKYGKPLYDAVCAICHDTEKRAAIVPDLHNLKTPTNMEFWSTWIAHGKPGSLMPAFATADGGPLNDMQVQTLASLLNMTIPSRPAPVVTNAPGR